MRCRTNMSYIQDALYSAVLDTRNTMLDTLRRVQWSPGATSAVASIEERLHSQCAHNPPADKHCSTASAHDPVQMSHDILSHARELLETLVDDVTMARGHQSVKPVAAASPDVQALQVPLESPMHSCDVHRIVNVWKLPSRYFL
jgi:hypothetical protein